MGGLNSNPVKGFQKFYIEVSWILTIKFSKSRKYIHTNSHKYWPTLSITSSNISHFGIFSVCPSGTKFFLAHTFGGGDGSDEDQYMRKLHSMGRFHYLPSQLHSAESAAAHIAHWAIFWKIVLDSLRRLNSLTRKIFSLWISTPKGLSSHNWTR